MKQLSEKKKWNKQDRQRIISFLKDREKRNHENIDINYKIPFYEKLIIIYKNNSYCIWFVPDNEEYFKKLPTFKDLLKKIKYDGGVVKFIFESYLNGIVYTYGNYCSKEEMKKVWFNGTLGGFA